MRSLSRKNKLPHWWGDRHDFDLLRGALQHGHSKFKKMRLDSTLCFHQFSASKLDSKVAASGEDGVEIESWPSDAVLTSRLRRLIEALPNGISPRVLKRKAAEVEARAEQRNLKIALKLEAQVERESKKPLKMEFLVEAAPLCQATKDLTVDRAGSKDDKIMLKKAKAIELRHERQLQLKASQWQSSIRDAFIKETALREAQIQSALGRDCAASPPTVMRNQLAESDHKGYTDFQFAEYEAATRRAMISTCVH